MIPSADDLFLRAIVEMELDEESQRKAIEMYVEEKKELAEKRKQSNKVFFAVILYVFALLGVGLLVVMSMLAMIRFL